MEEKTVELQEYVQDGGGLHPSCFTFLARIQSHCSDLTAWEARSFFLQEGETVQ